MLKKCVNPSCSKSFKHLREGKLLRIEVPGPHKRSKLNRPDAVRAPQYFWLCGVCSSMLNLALDRNSGIILIPIAAQRATGSSPSPKE